MMTGVAGLRLKERLDSQFGGRQLARHSKHLWRLGAAVSCSGGFNA